jgi:hypothetical protein
MDRRKNKTDELFHSHLRNFDTSPPEKAWKEISSRLSQDRKKQRMVVFWRMAASVLVLIGIGTTFLLIRPSTETPVAERDQAIESIEQENVPERQPHSSQEVILADVESKPSESDVLPEVSQDIIIEKSVTTIASLSTMTSISTISSERTSSPERVPMFLTGLSRYNTPDEQLLLAQVYSSPSLPQTEEGIDLLEDWEEDEQDSYSRWAIGSQVSPLYSYRSLPGNGESSATAGYFNDIENGMLAYAGGININYSPRKRLTLQSGLYYSKMGMKIGNAMYALNEMTFGASSRKTNLLAFSNSSGNIQAGDQYDEGLYSMASEQGQEDAFTTITDLSKISSLSVSEAEIIQNFEYLEIPVIMRYRVVDRKVGFNVIGGMSTNFLVGRDAYFQLEGEKEFLGITQNLKTVNYSSVIGVGLDYAITSKLNLNFEPTFRYYLNSVNTLSVLRSHPYSLGFYTGLRYSF